MTVAAASVAAVASKLVGSVGFAMRRARRLPDGPRRALVVESLAVALSLLTELADPTPELVRCGGLDLLANLASRSTPGGPKLVLHDLPLRKSEVVDIDPKQVDADPTSEQAAPMQAAEGLAANELVESFVPVASIRPEVMLDGMQLVQEHELVLEGHCVDSNGVISSPPFLVSEEKGLLAGFPAKTLHVEGLVVDEGASEAVGFKVAPVGSVGAPAAAKTHHANDNLAPRGKGVGSAGSGMMKDDTERLGCCLPAGSGLTCSTTSSSIARSECPLDGAQVGSDFFSTVAVR